ATWDHTSATTTPSRDNGSQAPWASTGKAFRQFTLQRHQQSATSSNHHWLSTTITSLPASASIWPNVEINSTRVVQQLSILILDHPHSHKDQSLRVAHALAHFSLIKRSPCV